MNQQPEDLRSCPFCLGLATLEKIEDGCYGVGCTDCDFQLMNGSVGIGWHESEQEAIVAWNERGGDQAMSQLRAWVKELQDENASLKATAQSKCLHQIQEPAPVQLAQPAMTAALFAARGALQHLKEGGKPTESLLNEAIAAIDSVATSEVAPAAATLPDERDAFETKFPAPPDCVRCGTGYASTSYNGWRAHDHVSRWEGWQARAALAATPAAKGE